MTMLKTCTSGTGNTFFSISSAFALVPEFYTVKHHITVHLLFTIGVNLQQFKKNLNPIYPEHLYSIFTMTLMIPATPHSRWKICWIRSPFYLIQKCHSHDQAGAGNSPDCPSSLDPYPVPVRWIFSFKCNKSTTTTTFTVRRIARTL